MTIGIITPLAFEPTNNVPANIHIDHPQLRDLIVCPDRGQIAYATNAGLATRSVTNKHEHERRLPSLGFSPTCVASGSGLIAAGGQQAQIYITPISSLSSAPEHGPWKLSTIMRGSINNSMFITNLTLSPNPYGSTHDGFGSSSSLNPRLFISNNDRSLRVFNITTECKDTENLTTPGLSKAGGVQLKTCVNHSSLSPDGRTMVAVGDTDEVFLYDVRGGDTVTFEPVATYKGAEDAGFSTAWSSDGLKFAIASQCGSAIIWDIRSSVPIAKFYSQEAIKYKRRAPFTIGQDGGYYWRPPPRPQLRSSTAAFHLEHTDPIVSTGVRSIKFSPKGAGLGDDSRDILVFTEHINNVHIVDAKTFNTHTVIKVPRLPPPPPPPTIQLAADPAPVIPEKPPSDHETHTHGSNPTENFGPRIADAPWCTPSSSPPASPSHRPSSALPSLHEVGNHLGYAFRNGEAGPMWSNRRAMMLDVDEDAHFRYRDDDADDNDSDSVHTVHRHRPSISPSYETSLGICAPPDPTISEYDIPSRYNRDIHLSGLCFDPTGRFMYVGTNRSVVEWDVGSRRWDGGEHGRVWESSEWA